VDVIPPLAEHELLLLLLQLGLLLLTARGLGELAVRFGLPSVVGELLAGVVLGPSLFGLIAPDLFRAIVPADPEQFHLLDVVSQLGVIMLLIVTGMETDITLIRQKGRSAAMISLFGIAVPFASGFALGQLMPQAFIADPSERLVFSLFIGTAMGISAIPVIAKVLIEMNVVRRDIGQITLAAGMIDDTIGWILLSVVAGLARGGGLEVGTVAQALISVVLVVGITLTIGRRVITWLFRTVDNAIGGDMAKITLLMALALLFGSFTHALGIEAVLGAFLVGIVVGQVKRFGQQTRHIFETVTLGVFAPIFFAASGLRVDLSLLIDPTVLGIGLVVLAIAIFGKFVGAAVGGRLSALNGWESLSLGAGMNARGAIEIIVATIGLSLGVLTQEMYTIILLVAIVTSLMAPPILRYTLQHIPLSDEERERIATDERRETSFIANLNRVLLPTRGGANSHVAGHLLGMLLSDEEVEVTTMSVIPAHFDEDHKALHAAERNLEEMDEHLAHLPTQQRRRLTQKERHDIVGTLVAEASSGYDLVVLGASEATSDEDDSLFGGLVNGVMQAVAVPVLVVSQNFHQKPEDLTLRRILLPTTGTQSSEHSVEVAAAIARNTKATVDVLHVIEWPRHAVDQAVRDSDDVGDSIVDRIREKLVTFGVESVETQVVRHIRPERAIVRRAAKSGADLIVLSSSRRPLSQRAFFGHRSEHVLRNAGCPVVVVS
jgi:Kef-type K+ transport system membrane component KefB/nucleotide-binding universal stress UspA family protein